MISGDELVRSISSKTVGGIVVGVDVDLLDGLPLVSVTLEIVTQGTHSFNGSMVRFPPCLSEDFCILTETAVDPLEHARAEHTGHRVTVLEARRSDAHAHHVERARSGERENVTARLEDAEALLPDSHGRDFPVLAHEVAARVELTSLEVLDDVRSSRLLRPEPIRRVRDHSIDRVVGKSLENLEAVPKQDLVDG
jgi:hypothetical protein